MRLTAIALPSSETFRTNPAAQMAMLDTFAQRAAQAAAAGGGTGQGPMLVGCLKAETARQALYLEEQFGA